MIQIHTNEIVLQNDQNIQIGLNELVADNMQICTYLFIGIQRHIPNGLYELVVKSYELEYNNSNMRICTKVTTYSQKGPKGGS